MIIKLTCKTLFIYNGDTGTENTIIHVIPFSSIEYLAYNQYLQSLTIERESREDSNFKTTFDNVPQEIFDDIVKHLEKHL